MPSSIENLLKSRRVEDRLRAIHQITGYPEGEEKSTLLIRMLNDRSNYVAALAANALGDCADWNACQAMVERFATLSEDGLKRDPGCHIRASLAFAFGRLEYSPALEVLLIGLRTIQIEPVAGVPFDTGTHLRANCALALGQLHAPGALPDIAFLLFDHGTDSTRAGDRIAMVVCRKSAARALGLLADPAALTPLALCLRYPHREVEEVLQECMRSLVALESDRAVEFLVPYLEYHDANMAAFAAVMIARAGAPDALSWIEKAIESLHGDPLLAVFMALTSLRTEEAQQRLHAYSKDERPELRALAQEVLKEAQI